jgi:hypothetical protein
MGWWGVWADDVREARKSARGVGGFFARVLGAILLVVAVVSLIAGAAAFLWLVGNALGLV